MDVTKYFNLRNFDKCADIIGVRMLHAWHRGYISVDEMARRLGRKPMIVKQALRRSLVNLQKKDSHSDSLDLPDHLPDDVWAIFSDMLKDVRVRAPSNRGRKKITARRCLQALIYVMATGCQWNFLPKQLPNRITVRACFGKLMQDPSFIAAIQSLSDRYPRLKDVNVAKFFRRRKK